MSTVIPEGFRLGDGWRTHRGNCACTRRSAIGVICLDHAPYVTENGEAACAAHAIEMGALVRVEAPTVPLDVAISRLRAVQLEDATAELTNLRAALATAESRADAAEDKLARIRAALFPDEADTFTRQALADMVRGEIDRGWTDADKMTRAIVAILLTNFRIELRTDQTEPIEGTT